MSALTERQALERIRATAAEAPPYCVNVTVIDRILADVVPATPAPAAPLADAELALFQRAAQLRRLATPGPWFFSVHNEQLYRLKKQQQALPIASFFSGENKCFEQDGEFMAVVESLNFGGLLARLAAAPRWVSVAERLPERGSTVLTAAEREGGLYYSVALVLSDFADTFSYWQPLPAAPTANAGKEPAPAPRNQQQVDAETLAYAALGALLFDVPLGKETGQC